MDKEVRFSDLELLQMLKNGSALAYTIIYNRYFETLYIHALQKLNDKEEAKDIIHELFTQIWKKRTEIEITGGLKAYLYTAVKNKILDFIAHQQVENKYINSLQSFIDQGICITDHKIREKQLTELIDNGIQQLPNKMREIFEMSRKQNLTHREIAVKLNISEQTVKTQVKNALKVLRTKLGTMLFLSL
ncbi:RNA polymerase sigma-70 factor [Pedobacter sp.]|uniref:RNA polymerase sigma-70 factor n=1 Tax=Pedobacter sp. TaxID=1411316 RepID=UPI00396C8FBD